jgi:hypothetical protein
VRFYLDRPGLLSGSWTSGGNPNGSTGYLFPAVACTVGGDVDPYNARCSGAPLWQGSSDALEDSISYSADSNTYVLVWESSSTTVSPYLVFSTPIVLEPTAWWWI